MKITVKEASDIPAGWKALQAKKTSTVRIRASNGVEKFKVSWEDAELTSDPTVDLIVISEDGKEYPCKKDIFFETYQSLPAFNVEGTLGGYKFIKKGTTTLIPIPQGFEVEIDTLEGLLPAVSYPDYIVIGAKGELYANSAEWVSKNLKII